MPASFNNMYLIDIHNYLTLQQDRRLIYKLGYRD